MEEEEQQQQQLPEDVLTNILQRLAPCYLARSRCVCKPWRTIIDARRLLRAHLLPLSLAGIFINFHDLILSEFFSRPTTAPTLSRSFDYLPCRGSFEHHCNGLLLLCTYYDIYVVNPAKRQWVQLPPRPLTPTPRMDMVPQRLVDYQYLGFDPTISPHYDVFVIPHVSPVYEWSDIQLDPATEALEWPPSPFMLHVFSSRTKEWEERSFVRQGDAMGTVADMRQPSDDVHRNAVYWRGVLYVHSQTNFVMRISLSDGKYQVIKPPVVDTELTHYPHLYLGKSHRGVYCALDDLMVIYILDESDGKMEWVVRGGIPMGHKVPDRPGPWTLLDINFHESRDQYDDDDDDGGDDEIIVQQKIEWDSDGDDVTDTINWDMPPLYDSHGYCSTFLGFHPYKEVVFYSDTLRRGLAYHLNSGKVQNLGNTWPKHYGTETYQPFIEASFPYTPWMGEFPGDS